jgi:hypothetical protein
MATHNSTFSCEMHLWGQRVGFIADSRIKQYVEHQDRPLQQPNILALYPRPERRGFTAIWVSLLNKAAQINTGYRFQRLRHLQL